jgi:hypothetical protein
MAGKPTPGLTALDQDREASMADEGGASGARMESEEERETLKEWSSARPHRHHRRLWLLLLGLSVGVAAGVLRFRRR